MTKEPNYDAEMKLPDGKRCDDCAHARRCFLFGFSEAGRTSCDFWPSRYRERVAAPEDFQSRAGRDGSRTAARPTIRVRESAAERSPGDGVLQAPVGLPGISALWGGR